jgi:hypothetical protein
MVFSLLSILLSVLFIQKMTGGVRVFKNEVVQSGIIEVKASCTLSVR